MARRIVREKGPQIVEEDYGDYLIHVSLSFNITSGKTGYYVYVGKRGERMTKVGDMREADRDEEAYDHGFAIGRAAIDLLREP